MLVWLAHGHREIPETVDEDGAYYPHVPLFGGLKVLETEGKKAGKFGPANAAVIDKLIEAGNLLARGRLEHCYPHSWRSKAPVIFRNTPQWFIRMDEPLEDDVHGGRTLRETALAAIDATAFYPEAGRNRIRAMVESRPDWLISRQRAWGSPLAMFVDKETGQPLHDADGQRAHRRADRARRAPTPGSPGPPATSSATTTPSATRRSRTSSTSGSTPARPTPSPWRAAPTATGRPTSIWKAPTSTAAGSSRSLLESCGTRGRAPYDAILTHGFTLDEKGEKMSKSLGNTRRARRTSSARAGPRSCACGRR